MEKRALIAVALSIAVFYLYSFLFPAPPKKVAEQGPQVKAGQVQGLQPQPQAAPVPAPSPAAEARDVTVQTDNYTAIFSSRGGGLKKLVLKKYRQGTGPAAAPITLLAEEQPDNYAAASTASGFPLDPNAVYAASSEGFALKGGEKGTLTFVFTSPAGVTLRKSYTFSGDGYAIDLESQLANSGKERVAGALQLVMPYRIDPKAAGGQFEVYGPVTFADQKAVTDKLKDLAAKELSYERNVLWSGFHDKYFLTSVLAKDGSIAAVRIRQTAPDHIAATISAPPLSLNPGEAAAVSYRLYFGPKDLDILKAQGSSLEAAIDLGWFSALAKPLLYTLKFFYRYTLNYGMAIIIITVILKLLFFPLTHKSYKSMKEMQKIQPMMNKLREKYKNDRDALNRAVMEMYKTHKVNPLGGCLPMLVQIPVFFALYKALMFSIELRHAPFILWITDLSAKDPYYVTPVIMGVTMVVQQKMTPSTMDPTQARIMMALPVVFTFMFLNFPSGLVLYWLVNNILTIAQQAYINRLIKE